MSTVETPPPTERQCPRCGAPMTDEQEWCLRCGAAVGTRIVAAPGWRTPFAIVGTLLALALIAIAIAIVQLADDTGEVVQAPTPTAAAPAPNPVTTPTPTPGTTATPDTGQATPTATPTVTPSATPSVTSTPSVTPDASGGTVASWPAGKSGWTVILASDTSKSAAESKARGFIGDGISGVGVLDSDDYSSLKGGYWVVFSGQYDSQSAASDALDGLDVKDAYIRRIAPN